MCRTDIIPLAFQISDNLACLEIYRCLCLSLDPEEAQGDRASDVECSVMPGGINPGVNKDHSYLWGVGSFGEVGICTGSKEVAGKAEFPHHEVIKQMVTFWLCCVGAVSMEYSETICAHIDGKMLWNYYCYEVCLLHANNSYKRWPCTVKRAISD